MAAARKIGAARYLTAMLLRSPLRPCALALCLAALPAPAATEDTGSVPLLCLGTAPPFLLAVRPGAGESARASFDYLGDGRFPVAPMPRPGPTVSHHRLDTAGGPIPFRLDPRACPALGMTFPVAIEMRVPAGRRDLTFRGCCIWQDG